MTWTAFDLSKAARRCKQVAEGFDWEAYSDTPNHATFTRGESFVLLSLSLNGGISRVATNEGAYTGANRMSWAVNYLREHGARRASNSLTERANTQ